MLARPVSFCILSHFLENHTLEEKMLYTPKIDLLGKIMTSKAITVYVSMCLIIIAYLISHVVESHSSHILTETQTITACKNACMSCHMPSSSNGLHSCLTHCKSHGVHLSCHSYYSAQPYADYAFKVD